MRCGLQGSISSWSHGYGPPSEACLYGHINWSQEQAQQQSSIGLSQSFPPRRGGKTRSETVFQFSVAKEACVRV